MSGVAMPASAVPLATGDVAEADRLLSRPDSAFVTCPRRDTACPYNHGPDRPDDYDAGSLLANPYCCECGCELVVLERGDYDGPPDKFHDLDREGSPLVA